MTQYTLTINVDQFPYGLLEIARVVDLMLIDWVCYELEASVVILFPCMTMTDNIFVQEYHCQTSQIGLFKNVHITDQLQGYHWDC